MSEKLSVGVDGFLEKYSAKESFEFTNGEGLRGHVVIGYIDEIPDAVLAYAVDEQAGRYTEAQSFTFPSSSRPSHGDAFSTGWSMLQTLARQGSWEPLRTQNA